MRTLEKVLFAILVSAATYLATVTLKSPTIYWDEDIQEILSSKNYDTLKPLILRYNKLSAEENERALKHAHATQLILAKEAIEKKVCEFAPPEKKDELCPKQ